MKHTSTCETSTGSVTVSVEVDYYVPRKGDTIYVSGHACKLTQDLKPRVELDYDGDRYVGKVMRTTDGTNRVVFIGYAECIDFPIYGEDFYTWREGESYQKQ